MHPQLPWTRGPAAFDAFVKSAEHAFEHGLRAFVWGMPLVAIERTRRLLTSMRGGAPLLAAPVNRFAHLAQRLRAEDHALVTPNADVLVSSAWLDLRAEPLVVNVPPASGRYRSLHFIDAFGEPFHVVSGRDASGTSVAVLGPRETAPVPDDLASVRARTHDVWLVGRTAVHGDEDRAAALALARQLTLATLSLRLGHLPPFEVPPEPTVPLGRVQDLAHAGLGFFDELCELLLRYRSDGVVPPAELDLGGLGLGPGRVPSIELEDGGARAGLEAAIHAGQHAIASQAEHLGVEENGWRILRHTASDALSRAALCHLGLAAPSPEEILYCYGRVDEAGAPLLGEQRYVLQFGRAGPPNDAFWSLTAYGNDGFLVDNPLDRYALGSHDSLRRGADGTVALELSHEPATGPMTNWLPLPEGAYFVILRVYAPQQAMLHGTYTLPPITRVR